MNYHTTHCNIQSTIEACHALKQFEFGVLVRKLKTVQTTPISEL